MVNERDPVASALPLPWPHEGSADELAAWISHEIETHALFPAEEARRKRVPQLLVFASYCAPRGASMEGLRLACGFLLAFFLFNDDWARHGETFDEAPSQGGRFVQDWLRGVAARFGARAARFSAAFERYRRSLFFEQSLKQSSRLPTLEEYVDRERGRYQWVATAPYVELWAVAEGIRLDDEQRVLAERLEVLGVELTYLANDIGSVRRDRHGRNFVTLLGQREQTRSSFPELLAATRAEYEARAREFREARQSTQGELARYAALVAAITDGNLKATLMLAQTGDAGRYASESRECLASLPELDGQR